MPWEKIEPEFKQYLKRIDGVEIFATGTHNGDKYTEADLDEMARAYTETKETVPPFLKLGHGNQDALARQGLPAAGWVENIRRAGSKLICDFVDIPDKLYQIILDRGYRKVSAEIYWNTSVGEKKYKRLLTAVALLGQATPGVMTLKDILAQYSLAEAKVYGFDPTSAESKTYDMEDTMTEQEKIAALEAEKAELASKLATFEATQTEARVEAERIKAEADKAAADLATANEKLAEYAKREADAALEREAGEVEKAAGTSPAMRPYILAMLGEEKKEYAFEGDKKFSKFALLSEVLKLYAEARKVNLKDSTETGDKSAAGNADNEKIEKYQAENKCSYAAAYKAVMRTADVSVDADADTE